MSATIVALHLSHASRAPLTRVDRAEALVDRGLDGDRHAKPGSRRSILVIEQEVLDQHGLAPGDVREQMTVRGIDLGRLVFGSRLQVGTAVLEVAAGLRQQLEGQRGRFVRVVEGGSVAVGDSVQVQPPL